MNINDNQETKAAQVESPKASQKVVVKNTPRHQMILKALDSLEQQNITNITDRQIAEACGFSDMNAVRPRITELINMGRISDGLNVTCPKTDKKVRTLHSSRKREE